MNASGTTGTMDDEAYLNAYYHFHNSVAVLSEDAVTQCEAMNGFNVAWEIRDDISKNGYALLNTSGERLSEEKKCKIKLLLKNVAAVPDVVVRVPNSSEAHLRAMRASCWLPIRVQAKELMSLLEPETNWVNSILFAKDS